MHSKGLSAHSEYTSDTTAPFLPPRLAPPLHSASAPGDQNVARDRVESQSGPRCLSALLLLHLRNSVVCAPEQTRLGNLRIGRRWVREPSLRVWFDCAKFCPFLGRPGERERRL